MLTLEQARALRDGITPGPWELETDPMMSSVSSHVGGDYHGVTYMSLDNHENNARAIAALPDLLDLIEAQAGEIAALKRLLIAAREWDWLAFADYRERDPQSAAECLPSLVALDAEITRMTEGK